MENKNSRKTPKSKVAIDRVLYLREKTGDDFSNLDSHFLLDIKPGFHMVVTVVKLESRSFSSAEIQHFRTENTRSDYI